MRFSNEQNRHRGAAVLALTAALFISACGGLTPDETEGTTVVNNINAQEESATAARICDDCLSNIDNTDVDDLSFGSCLERAGLDIDDCV